METPIIAALVGAIVGPLFGFALTIIYQQRLLEPMARNRRKALKGRWDGEMKQDIHSGKGPEVGKITAELNPTWRAVGGTLDINVTVEGKLRHLKLVVTAGGFRHDRFLKLDYKNLDATTIQFGTMIMALSADRNTLRGHYVGYGSITERIVYGTIDLQKQP